MLVARGPFSETGCVWHSFAALVIPGTKMSTRLFAFPPPQARWGTPQIAPDQFLLKMGRIY